MSQNVSTSGKMFMIKEYFFFRLKQWESDKYAAEETARKLGQNLADKDAKRLKSVHSSPVHKLCA